MRIIETKIDKPKAPSQTLKVKNIILKNLSYLIIFKYINKKRNKLNTINSKLNRVHNKCLRFETKTITPLKNKNKGKNQFNNVIISFNSLTKTLVL